MMSKLMEMISDPSAKEKLSDTVSKLTDTVVRDEGTSSDKNISSGPFDLLSGDNAQLMYKMQHMLERLNSKDDSRIGLLNSMKPFMRESRSKSIDTAIRFIQLLNFATGK